MAHGPVEPAEPDVHYLPSPANQTLLNPDGSPAAKPTDTGLFLRHVRKVPVSALSLPPSPLLLVLCFHYLSAMLRHGDKCPCMDEHLGQELIALLVCCFCLPRAFACACVWL